MTQTAHLRYFLTLHFSHARIRDEFLVCSQSDLLCEKFCDNKSCFLVQLYAFTRTWSADKEKQPNDFAALEWLRALVCNYIYLFFDYFSRFFSLLLFTFVE